MTKEDTAYSSFFYDYRYPPFEERVSLRELSQSVLDKVVDGKTVTTEAEYMDWLASEWPGIPDSGTGRAVVEDRATALVMVETWLEAKLRARVGVWFARNNYTSYYVNLANPISEGGGVSRHKQVKAPAWINGYIRSFPVIKYKKETRA